MGREAKFNKDQFLEAALELAVRGGPKGVTMAGLAEKTGAPIGSIYHRFSSRNVLLAELWLGLAEDFQSGFTDGLGRLDRSEESGLVHWRDSALYTPRWVRGHFNEAQILLLFRREEFLYGKGLAGFQSRAAGLAGDLNLGLGQCSVRLWGDKTPALVGRLVFALIDIPFGAVRRHLETGRTPPEDLDDLILKAARAVLEGD